MATTSHRSAQEHASSFTSRQRTVALVIVALAFVMDLLDSTVVNVAIPTIRDNLGASYAAIQWILAGYTLSFALLLVTGGRMGDIFGYKKLFMTGVAGFTVASLLSGLAPNATVLVIARILQGAMAALMVPQVMSLMQVMYKPHERGSINGLFGALGGLAASLGPVIGGLLIKLNLFSLDWRPIFLINVPIGILGLIGAVRYLPNGKSPHPLRLDITGTVLVMIAMFLLVFPLIEGRELGWPNWTYLMMFLSLPGFLGFAWWQRRKERTDSSPLVLPALFKNPSFGVGLGVNLIFEMAMIGFFLTFTLILQIGLGYTAIHAALTGIPTAVGIAMTMAILGEKVVPKMGRYALTSGTIIMAVGLVATTWVLHRYQLQVHSWQLIVPLFVVGIGMGLVFGALFAAVLNGVDASHAGSASGVLNAIQQVGGAIGVALIGVVFFGQLSHGAVNSFSTVEPRLHTALTSAHIPGNQQNRIIAGVQQCFVDRSRAKDDKVVPASCHNLNTQTNDTTLTNAIAGSALQANATNFSQAFKWSIVYDLGLLAVTCALSFVLPAHFRTEAYSELA